MFKFFVSRKEYQKLAGVLDNVNNEYLKELAENENLREKNFDLNSKNVDLVELFIKQKKDITKLKQLCTKNGIDYSHLFRKEK